MNGLPLPRRTVELGGEEPAECPACGSSRGDLVATGEVGCPVCYDAFAATIASVAPLPRPKAPRPEGNLGRSTLL